MGTTTNNLISVIIPVYNGERFLREAIDSVLSQDHSPFEVIVVDDGSADSSAILAESFGGVVQCVRQQHGGAAAARNAGVALSKGGLLAFLDADDVWLPGKLRLQLDRLAADPSLECVFGLLEHIYEAGEADRLEVRVSPVAAGLIPGTMLIRRDAFLRVGAFSQTEVLGEFIEWYMRAQERNVRFEMIQQVVMHRRVHAHNSSLQNAAWRSDYLRIFRSRLERRRSAER
jgi:glycosyltransferase involved in cell wall biosynthesis